MKTQMDENLLSSIKRRDRARDRVGDQTSALARSASYAFGTTPVAVMSMFPQQDDSTSNSNMLSKIRRRAGEQQVPTILVEQSNKQIRSKNILSRIMKDMHQVSKFDQALDALSVRGKNVASDDEEESSDINDSEKRPESAVASGVPEAPTPMQSGVRRKSLQSNGSSGQREKSPTPGSSKKLKDHTEFDSEQSSEESDEDDDKKVEEAPVDPKLQTIRKLQKLIDAENDDADSDISAEPFDDVNSEEDVSGN